jgi:hypothetical protein
MHVESVVADGSPLVVLENLHPAPGTDTTAEAKLHRMHFLDALNTHIFMMTAIVIAPTTVMALLNRRFFSVATHVIQPNLACTSPELLNGCDRTTEAQLTANHLRIIHAETVVADGAPLVVLENLHPAPGPGTTAEANLQRMQVLDARNTHIFMMTAIVGAPTIVTAFLNRRFASVATHVIQPNLA